MADAQGIFAAACIVLAYLAGRCHAPAMPPLVGRRLRVQARADGRVAVGIEVPGGEKQLAIHVATSRLVAREVLSGRAEDGPIRETVLGLEDVVEAHRGRQERRRHG